MGGCLGRCKKKRKQNSTANILRLPSQLREKIWRCVDNHTKKTLRLVCASFKEEIDLGTGLSVKLNSNDQTSLELIKKVEVKKVLVQFLSNALAGTKIFRCELNVEYLDIRCSITQDLFQKLVVPLSEHLLSLSLMARSLMLCSILPHDRALGAAVKFDTGFTFPNLVALQIQYGNLVPRRRGENLSVFNFNMVTIMKSFYCPRLLCFVIHPDPDILRLLSEYPEQIPHSDIEWENNPLKSFVSLHSSTLKLLDLFLYSRYIEEDHYNNYRCPDLSDYIIVVPFVKVARLITRPCYWRQIVVNCKQLSRLILQIEFFHNYVEFFAVSSGIFENNGNHLTTIRLESFAMEEEYPDDVYGETRHSLGHTLNFSLFMSCRFLRVLEVYQLDIRRNLIGIGISSLPETLERLEIKRILIPSEEIYELKNYRRLQRALFYHVGQTLFFGVNYTALKRLWSNPSLKTLRVCGFNFSESEAKMKRIIQKTQRSPVDWSEANNLITMTKHSINKQLKI